MKTIDTLKKDNHDIAYFLTNRSFVTWVKNPNPDSNYFWKKWIENNPQSRESFYAAKATIERIDFKKANVTEKDKEEVLNKILQNSTSKEISFEKPQKRIFKLHRTVYSGVAAAIVILIVSVSFLNQYNNEGVKESEIKTQSALITKTAERGKQKAMFLPDGSKVILNAGSSLSYYENFTGDTREVTLVGEAYFDVTHNPEKKFIVKSNGIATVVHGTSFNVKAYPNEGPLSVALERGSVAVQSLLHKSDSTTIFIKPGEKITVEEQFENSLVDEFNYIEEFGWKDGILVFKDAGIEEFIGKLERWYNVDISVVGRNDHDWEINGMFKKQSLQNVLESLEFARKVKYTIKENQITIYTDLKN